MVTTPPPFASSTAHDDDLAALLHGVTDVPSSLPLASAPDTRSFSLSGESNTFGGSNSFGKPVPVVSFSK